MDQKRAVPFDVLMGTHHPFFESKVNQFLKRSRDRSSPRLKTRTPLDRVSILVRGSILPWFSPVALLNLCSQ